MASAGGRAGSKLLARSHAARPEVGSTFMPHSLSSHSGDCKNESAGRSGVGWCNCDVFANLLKVYVDDAELLERVQQLA